MFLVLNDVAGAFPSLTVIIGTKYDVWPNVIRPYV